MASSSSPPSSGKLEYYYILCIFSFIFVVLLIISFIAMGCCTWFQRQFLSMRRLLNEEEEAALECVICLSTFNEGDEVRQLLSCKHLFHASCIDLWLNTHDNCPICHGIVILHSMNMLP
ncbi:RING-H2 finger protein ATL8 [Dendrobium catenatum]|uniref:RING-H2 finger protein ATL8 n=1 Tax=Dendrobium catenatum TaxID=906689 RepID=A0A2I0XCL8_9ASPA|nr:RING-H2 finger protein ATL8 [Dendrobium catenatum]